MNFFEVFELPRRLAVDGDELQRRFYALARRTHPDFHQAAPPAERTAVEERAALVNAAYRTLRDPIARVDYLVRLEEGRETREGDSDRRKAPPALLQEMFEIQETLAKIVDAAQSDVTTQLGSLEETVLTLAEALLRPNAPQIPAPRAASRDGSKDRSRI